MQWQLLSSQIPQNQNELEKILLANRGISDAKSFFQPPSPLEITLAEVGIDETQMQRAVERIQQAKEKQEDVLIFGDYDADGICATAVLWEGLKSAGVIARPFIPHREKHGYGLSLRSLAAVLAEKKPNLLISVDNGIVAHEAFAELRRLGIETILTDHHQPEENLPSANIILHTTKVSGTGVAWFFARSLSKASAENSLDLAAVATIADQMPLLNINRAIVFHGLQALRQTQRVGLQLLMAKAGVDLSKLDSTTVNYSIAPRINAMGRLKHGMNALRLLCTKNIERADELVRELQDTNVSRQELTSAMIEHALASAATWQDEHLIIVASTEYHEGVIGLLAGKLSEKFYKPAIAIAIGEKVAKASARSIRGVNIIDLIREVKSDLLEAGGHPMAAGFGVSLDKIELVREKLLVIARQKITANQLQPHVAVDCLLSENLVTLATCNHLQKFAPFGQLNPEPIFGLRNCAVLSAEAMGKENRHLKMVLEPADLKDDQLKGKPLTCIGWGMGERAVELAEASIVHIAGVLNCNEWKNRQSLQVMIKDVSY